MEMISSTRILTYIMNWRIKFLILTAIAVTVFSCKKKENDQIKLQPDEVVGAFVDSDFSVSSFVNQEDSVFSSHGIGSISRHLAGSIKHDNFGQLNTSFSTQIKIPDDNFLVDNDAVFINGNLVLDKNYFYGESGDLSILIYELASDLEAADTYFTSDKVTLGGFIQEIVVDSELETQTIPLNQAFVSKVRQLENKLSNQADLNSILKGFNFQPSNISGVVGFNPLESKIVMNYEVTTSTGTKDTIAKEFILGDNIAHFNSFSYDRTGSVIEALSEEEVISTSNLNDVMLVQPGTRIDGNIIFSDLKDKVYNTGEFIYKAELEFIVDQPNYIKSGESSEAFIDINFNDTLTSTLVSTVSNGLLTFDVTNEVQQMISGDYEILDVDIYASKFGDKAFTFWVNNPNENITLKIYFNE